MPTRVFLGYDSPFLPKLVDHLLSDRDSLAGSLVIVPTSQSGRTLRESLAASANALLAPTVSTPGALLHLDDPNIAPKWLEKIAWIETLDSLSASDWENYDGLFPMPPDQHQSSDWATSLANEIVSLRATLQDHLHNLFSASKFLKNTPEEKRWEDLAKIESLAEKTLSSWGYTSRSTALRSNFQLPDGFAKIILAGITEMPPCLAQALEKFPGGLTALVAAPESEQDNFSDLGLPLPIWADRKLPSSATVEILADPSSQAKAALDRIAASVASSDDIALGSADEQTGSSLAHALTESGWPAFHPASSQPLPPILRWLRAWKDWVAKPDSRHLAALLTFPESSAIISGNRAGKLLLLNQLRDRHPTISPTGLLQHLANKDESQTAELREAISNLLSHRETFLTEKFSKAILNHLGALRNQSKHSAETISSITDFLETASPLFPRIDRSHIFWLQVLLSEVPTPPAQPPANRVIDIQGWLELLYEPGSHLVICGMNDSFVPARSGGEPWLSENIRERLSLNSDADRHARDSFLLHAMVKMREQNGSSHLLCGKNGNGGETYLPSRLLLNVPRENLVSSVRNLFREIEPPEANLIWSRDWKWQTPAVELPERLSVTALRDYLTCPFRFYMKHIVCAKQPEPDRREMNARDFGSITHTVLENWANDPEALTISDSEKLNAYLESALDDTILREFGKKPPLAIRIQVHAIRQRLEWFARQQAISSEEGWEILHVERKIAIPSAAFTVSGKIDRVDRHRETGQLRVIDYKTGNVKNIESEHRKKITARTRLPAHIKEGEAPFQSGTDPKGKPTDFLWNNLQLPLYALAESTGQNGEVPVPCYIHLGKTKENVGFTTWETFSKADLDSAKSCMDWITSRIADQCFWPPAEKVPYDDYSLFSQDAPLEEAFSKLKNVRDTL